MSVRLAGARALVTGASGGLGRAIVHALHARGATVVVTGRREEELAALRSELGGARIEPLVADLAREGAADRLLAEAGEVDVLVVNAAVPASGPVDSFSAEELDRALDVNLRVPLHMARLLVPRLSEQGRGHLVFVSSMNGKVPTVGASVYAATKYGLRGFAYSLREDLRGTGVGVTSIFPSFIADAGMWADTGISLPRAVKLPPPAAVGDAVVRGIERDRVEIDVAPLPFRAGGWIAGAAPGAVAWVSRVMGARQVADAAAEAQRVKR